MSRLNPNDLVSITPNVQVPRHRAVEWHQGTRPLPGQDADFFFRQAVEVGILTSDDAWALLRRHQELTRQEAAVAEGALVCATCAGAPPPGFACTKCGASSQTA